MALRVTIMICAVGVLAAEAAAPVPRFVFSHGSGRASEGVWSQRENRSAEAARGGRYSLLEPGRSRGTVDHVADHGDPAVPVAGLIHPLAWEEHIPAYVEHAQLVHAPYAYAPAPLYSLLP